jgi:ribosomal protein S6--L-glutamate ligase
VEPVKLNSEYKRISIDAAEAIGLEIAGIDIIEEPTGKVWVVDVNYSPGFRGLEKATGKDIALEIIKYALKRAG